jgi:hypothetical protein
MGYTTKFTGHLTLSRKLTMAEAKTLLEIAEEDTTIEQSSLAAITDPAPPRGYMQWVPDTSLQRIVWDESEKFYDYEQWLKWIVAALASWGIEAAGSFKWQGESVGDTGELLVVDGNVTSTTGTLQGIQASKPLTLRKLQELALQQLTGA